MTIPILGEKKQEEPREIEIKIPEHWIFKANVQGASYYVEHIDGTGTYVVLANAYRYDAERKQPVYYPALMTFNTPVTACKVEPPAWWKDRATHALAAS